jgi:hypothetical protein
MTLDVENISTPNDALYTDGAAIRAGDNASASGENVTDQTHPLCPPVLEVPLCPNNASHMRIVVSIEPETMRVPSEDNAAE